MNKVLKGTKTSRWFRELNEPRKWEDFYRRRWQYDKSVRTSHSVNCSGSCSWEVFVKNGMITWELQKTDWPQINDHTPSYEPRGCQRGISSSWYPYSPVRPKFPYVRGVLLNYYRQERKAGKDPVAAWAAIVENPEKSAKYRNARGKAGWRRTSWDEAAEIIAAAKIYTIKQYGPDHLASFSPIPAMSMVSFLSGHRLSNLLGGTMLSFYEWYHDLPHVMPMIWGDQTDVHESADWYQSAYWIVMGSNLPMTRTADAHFASEHKYNGGKLVNLSPDYSDVTKFADLWVPVRPGTDTAFLMACIHVILQEFHVDRRSEYFLDYVGQYTNLPFLVILEEEGDHYGSGRFLRASDLGDYSDEELGEWKFPLFDKNGDLRLPGGSVGFRWEEKTTGRWNLKNEDARTGEAYEPRLTLMDGDYEEVQVEFADFTHTYNVELGTTQLRGNKATPTMRGVPSKVMTLADGSKVRVTTAYDLLLAQYGVRRGLSGDGYPADYDDAERPYTPAWQEQETGVDRNLAIRVAREWADTAEKTQGKCLFITGSGILHWYHGGSLTYRAEAVMGILTGCQGRNGGGFAHYVGTEKIRNFAAIGTIGGAADWGNVGRQQNSTSFFYFHTDQWRYDGMSLDPLWAPRATDMPSRANHSADMNAVAVRNGWLPFFPQFDEKNPLDVMKEARAEGVDSDTAVGEWVAKKFKDRELKFALPNVDAEKNHPKVLWIYRGNLIGTSMRGHEINLKHMLGTHHNVLGGDERAKDMVHEIDWSTEAPLGKLDLIYNVNLRMDSSANYSDIVLPTAHWYEKDDVTCTDLHSFLHPFTPAHDPAWECKHDWEAFRIIAEKISDLAQEHLPEPVEDLVMTALNTDTPDELAQPMGELKDWWKGEVEPVPGKTFPNVKVIERDYTQIHEKYTTLGPEVTKPNGYGAKGIKSDLAEVYEQLKDSYLVGEKSGKPSLHNARQVCETILRMSPESDGELSYQIFKKLEKRTGVPLAHLVEHDREIAYHFPDLISQPRRSLTSPHWSAIETKGRTYSPWTLNIEALKPFHTLTGRQEVYYDHKMFRDLGEDLPTYKPPVDMVCIGDVSADDLKMKGAKLFRFITPHQKWGIHSMFHDSWQMMNMFRGGPTVWINDDDAKEIDVEDNDWVEIFNENGIQVARAVVSHTVPRDMSIVYHQTERHVNVPFSSLARERGATDLRGGNNNATTRIMMNPATMVGGYANWTYWLNYQGTSPSERDCAVLIRKKPPEADGRKVIYQEHEIKLGKG
ncbi:nitrate reductase alpha subunit [Rhodovulum imhoffii]|uniref:nitrate reductase (quinone) n=1 Tax=Rhodovulum imhoffii TaxID=365340 RepID=A0A2T5BP09_9RHOB|nr:nitrate reductase subunit alpha [Rhodovulum imhoffii]MBK5933649.1 nitrate reductase subunit alpha [Rhodovulum imhoffii]PTN00733.1 nitrate reductase alpha subunit [Rhodovulum imhoffii]